MLQQTQVKTVLPRYAEWFDRFPDIRSLAAADPDAVFKAWEGLGYYRRAKFIHAAAKHMVAEHAGVFPQNFDDILKLPGIGRSTAGAIASFCFAARTPVLDGNVKRVLSRWRGVFKASDRELWTLAQQAMDTSNAPADWNQAMMELGATLCSPREPDCGVCPVASFCDSAFEVQSKQLQQEKRKPVRVADVYWKVRIHNCPRRGIWLTRRPEKGIWAGLWTPPISEMSEQPENTPDHVHLLTHRRLHLYAEMCPDEPDDVGIWVANLSDHALPTGIRRMLEVMEMNQ